MELFDVIEDIVDGLGEVKDGIVDMCVDSIHFGGEGNIDQSKQQPLKHASSNERKSESRNNVQPNKKLHSEKRAKQNQELTPAKSLIIQLARLREEESRAIDEITKNGDNVFANVTDCLFSSPKTTKFWKLAKTITGKTKTEKIDETRILFDQKKAQLIDRTMTPSYPSDIWEMLMVAKELYNQTSLGVLEKAACKNLLIKLIETSEFVFESDLDRKLIIRTIKENNINTL